MQDQGSVVQRTVRLMERTVILVFGVTVVLAMMYVAGNYQGFSDATQLNMLSVLQALSGGVVVAAASVTLLEIWEVIALRRWRRLLRSFGFVLVGLIALSLSIGSTGLLVLFQPL